MAATIYSFPKLIKEPEYRLPLYSDEEVEVTIICVNVFSHHDIKYNIDTLCFLDTVTVLECLKSATSSKIFSEKFKTITRAILKNVEEVK